MNRKLIYLGILTGGLAACGGPAQDVIRLNQVGYYPTQEKVAVAEMAGGKTFSVVDASTGEEVLTGTTETTLLNSWTKQARSVMNFGAVDKPGRYFLLLEGDTAVFEVREHALAPVADAALKAFYYQRASMPLEETYAGQWARPAGHPDTEVLVHPGAAGPKRKADDRIAVPGGWYTGSGYDKSVTGNAYSAGILLTAYRLFPEYFAQQNTHIPESNNRTPDLLDEVYYSLEWLLTMQDPADGGVYHKVCTTSDEGLVKPADCKQQRYVAAKSVEASAYFAAVMAQAAQVFKSFGTDYPGFAAKALRAAERAYNWAGQHPKSVYAQDKLNEQYDPDITTDTYSNEYPTDELFWAETELYYATGQQKYLVSAAAKAPRALVLPRCKDVWMLGVFTWLLPDRKLDPSADALYSSLKSYLTSYASKAIKGADEAAFHAPFGDEPGDFFKGCLAEQCAAQAVTLAYTYMVDNKWFYLTNAYRNMDYLLGRNPLGYCYVTGLGSHSPMHPVHSLSASDGIEAPVPGLLVGGSAGNDAAPSAYPSSMIDELYLDSDQDALSNSVAVDWNATLVAASSMLDALSQKRAQ